MGIDNEVEVRLVIYTPTGRVLLAQHHLKDADSTIYMLPRTQIGTALTSADAALAFFDDSPLEPSALCALCVLRPDVSTDAKFFTSYGAVLVGETEPVLRESGYTALAMQDLDDLMESGKIAASDYALLAFAERTDLPRRLADLD